MDCSKCYHKENCKSIGNERCKRYVEVIEGKFVKLAGNVCQQCKYSGTAVGTGSDNKRERAPVCCDYLGKTSQFRLYKDHKKYYDPSLCDKFEAGRRIKATPWDSIQTKRKRIKGGINI